MTTPADHAATVRYAEQSKGWTHGQKTEDELLQRIWNLAADVTKLAERANELERDLRNMERAADRDRRDREEMGNALARERAKPEGAFDQWARLQAAEARAEQLRKLVVEHHAVGAMDGLEWGGTCPVCQSHPTLRAALDGAPTPEPTAWGPDHPSYDEMGQ